MKKVIVECALFSTLGIVSFGFYQKIKPMSAITMIQSKITKINNYGYF